MKLRPDFDDEFQPKGQRWAWPVRSIGLLIIVVMVCGAMLSVRAGTGKHGHRRIVSSIFPHGRQRPVPVTANWAKHFELQPRDPFVVVAAAEIDAKMVAAAPVGIDEAMVFNPYTGQRQSAQGAPAPGSPLMPLPGIQPGWVPDYYHFAPQGLPQLPAPTQPR